MRCGVNLKNYLFKKSLKNKIKKIINKEYKVIICWYIYFKQNI